MALKDIVQKAVRLFEPAAPEAKAEFDKAPDFQVVELVRGKKISSFGTEIYAGYFAEEYLNELRGKRLAIEFDKVRRTDAQVKMLISAVLNPICSAKYEVQPASDSDQDKKIADLIKHILFCDMKRPFKSTIRQAGSVLTFGHAPMEKTFKLVMNHPEFKTYHGLSSLDLISQKTIERWNLDRETGDLLSIEQIANGDLGKTIKIERRHFVLFVIDQEGANYEGVSWLRPIYGNWFRKKVYQKLNAIGIEKFAVPTPVVKFMQGAQNDGQFENILEAMEVYTSGQANYLTLPNGYEVELKPNTYDPEKVEASIDKEDIRMAKAWCANFLELGLNGTGAFALSNDLSDFFLSGLTQVADEICSTIDNEVIKELVDLNFGPQAKYPTLRHSGITDKAGKELADTIKTFIDGKVITPDDELEKHVRKRLDLPEMSEVGRRDTTPPNPFGGGEVDEEGNPMPPKPGQPPKPGAPKPPMPPKEEGKEGEKKTLSERILRRLYAN